MPRIPGADAAGVVAALGEGVDDLAVGDRVLIDPGLSCGRCLSCHRGEPTFCRGYKILGESCDGTYCTRLVVPAVNCLPIPAGWDFGQAAAFPLTALTAWRMLVVRGRLAPGEDVLVLAGAAGVGVMCIQIAKLMGCRVLATASTEAKRALCTEVGADVVIDYTQEGWVREVKAATGRRGVDVTVDYVGKTTWKNSLKATAKGGRIVTCGATTGHDPTEDLRHIFFRQLSIIGSTMGSRADLVAALKQGDSGRLRPIIHQRLPLAEAATAHALIEDRAVLGKLVLEMPT
jgi:NADPH:quinone reductase-like Zn-dependent oxidoreductase